MTDVDPRRYRHVLRLSDEVARRVIWAAKRGARFTKLLELADALGLPQLGAILERYPKVKTRPLVTSIPFPRLLELEESAARSGYALERSLSSYWLIDSRGHRRARSLITELKRKGLFAVAEVGKRGGGRVYEEPELKLAGELSQPWHYLPARKGYWSAAPHGIDARYAWRKGFNGEGVRFVDIESSWNYEHRALKHLRSKLDENGVKVPFCNETVPVEGEGDCPEHGTNVLGVVAGWDSQRRHRGIAPNCSSVATVSHRTRAEGGDNWDLAGAIVYAVSGADELLGFGDVLLIEVQTLDNLPVEVVEHYYLAIKLAVGNGVIVVECAGNAGYDLDPHCEDITGDWSPSISICRDDPRFRDSGAILVAAGKQGAVRTGRRRWSHEPCASSNVGTRVDCYAWGENIVTAGGGDDRTPCNDRYSERFGGTSGAGAIIAGAAILVQQMQMGRAHGRHLPPDEVRAILSNPKNGTPGSNPEMGVMPNLRVIYERMQAGEL